MEMFISFFTGKVILFFGISLIMKEKSNASALLREETARSFFSVCEKGIKTLEGEDAVP